jgi:hypoxanthine phosphoribosyltransferase
MVEQCKNGEPAAPLKRVLVSEKDIQQRLQQLATQISDDCEHGELSLIGILDGSFMFVADLARALTANDVHPQIDFITLKSYGETTAPLGEVKLTKDVSLPLADRWVLVVDDILDTGHTLAFAKRYIMQFHPRQLKTCVLLDKEARRQVDCKTDYYGFRIPNEFVVGYGLDWGGWFRSLPYIAVLGEPPQGPITGRAPG